MPRHLAPAPYRATGGATLYIHADSSADIMLLINLPDATWLCDDDSGDGTDPVVVIPKAASGLYNIWVGTYGDETTRATLRVSEVDPR